jgi:hypothetical protein
MIKATVHRERFLIIPRFPQNSVALSMQWIGGMAIDVGFAGGMLSWVVVSKRGSLHGYRRQI